ncbi:ribbon-helix-helix protein, CopG family [Puniceicoccaceae bacterium K14]|nr:ribbon-helix-helix protein, CopG family [Puniceicoccaceae bacterium K14]
MTSLRLFVMSKKVDKNKKGDKRKNTSLRLDDVTLKKLKIHAIKEDTSIQKIIEKLIQEYVKKNKL